MKTLSKPGWSSKLVVAATACFILAIGFRVAAGAASGDQQSTPKPQTAVGLPVDNIHSGNEMVLWGYSNDEWAKMLQNDLEATEAQAKATPGEGYEESAASTRQTLEAVCALPDTTVC